MYIVLVSVLIKLILPTVVHCKDSCAPLQQNYLDCLVDVNKTPNCNISINCGPFDAINCTKSLNLKLNGNSAANTLYTNLLDTYNQLSVENGTLNGYINGNETEIFELEQKIKDVNSNISDLKKSTDDEDFRGEYCRQRDKYVWEKTQANPKANVNTKTVVACEGESANLECPAGTNIQILFATYGRLDIFTCLYQDWAPITCYADQAVVTSAIANTCSDLSKPCSVASSNSVFGDPCPNVAKNTEILYTCI